MLKKSRFSFIKIINVLLVTIPYSLVWILYYVRGTLIVHSRHVSILMIALYMFGFYYFCSKMDGFRVSIRRISERVFSQIIAAGATDVSALVGIWMLSARFPNIFPGLCCFAVQCVVVLFTCYISHAFFFKTYAPKKAIIIYDERQGMEDLIHDYGMENRFDVLAVYAIEDVLGRTAEESQIRMEEKLSGNIEYVFLCGVHSHDRNIILKYCVNHNLRVLMIPRTGDAIMASAEQVHMFHLPFLMVNRYNPSTMFLFAKRVFDVVVSGLCLIILSPLMGIIALMVKSDGGPALYKQVRLTKNGKEFKILKFRSMIIDAEKDSGAVLSAGENDLRITKVGRFIRACRMDELPQLWNIIVGDMSIVGPRPERPEIAKEYEKEMPEFALRLQCKAGLTGYAQVYGKYNTTPYDKTLMDLMYIAKPSILEDLIIILKTIQIVCTKAGMEGADVAGAYNPRLCQNCVQENKAE